MSCGSSAWMRSTVSMTLAPASLVIVSRIAGCLPFHAASRVLATPSITVATSDSAQDRAVAGLDHQRRIVRGLRNCPLMPIVFGAVGPWNAPVGSRTLVPRIAL